MASSGIGIAQKVPEPPPQRNVAVVPSDGGDEVAELDVHCPPTQCGTRSTRSAARVAARIARLGRSSHAGVLGMRCVPVLCVHKASDMGSLLLGAKLTALHRGKPEGQAAQNQPSRAHFRLPDRFKGRQRARFGRHAPVLLRMAGY